MRVLIGFRSGDVLSRLNAIPVTVFALVQVSIGTASHHLDEGIWQVVIAVALASYVVALTLRIRWIALAMLVAPPVVGLACREIGLEYSWRAAAVIVTTIAIGIALDLRERNDGSDGSETALDVV